MIIPKRGALSEVGFARKHPDGDHRTRKQ